MHTHARTHAHTHTRTHTHGHTNTYARTNTHTHTHTRTHTRTHTKRTIISSPLLLLTSIYLDRHHLDHAGHRSGRPQQGLHWANSPSKFLVVSRGRPSLVHTQKSSFHFPAPQRKAWLSVEHRSVGRPSSLRSSNRKKLRRRADIHTQIIEQIRLLCPFWTGEASHSQNELWQDPDTHTSTHSCPLVRSTWLERWDASRVTDRAQRDKRAGPVERATYMDWWIAEHRVMSQLPVITEWLRPRSGRQLFWIIWRMWGWHINVFGLVF